MNTRGKEKTVRHPEFEAIIGSGVSDRDSLTNGLQAGFGKIVFIIRENQIC